MEFYFTGARFYFFFYENDTKYFFWMDILNITFRDRLCKPFIKILGDVTFRRSKIRLNKIIYTFTFSHTQKYKINKQTPNIIYTSYIGYLPKK